MNKIDQSLQQHIDNNLSKVTPMYSASLNKDQKKELQACLDLHYSLHKIRVKDSFGKLALRNALDELIISEGEKQSSKNPIIKFAAMAVAGLVLIFAVGGFSILSNNTPTELSSDNIKPNGSVDNLQNLNLADAENDTKLVEATSATTITEADMNQTPTIDEAIDENF